MRINDIIKRPIVTEKSTAQTGHNQYSFEVGLNISKRAVADAISDMFGVDVLEVRTTVVPGRQKRVQSTRTFTKIPKWKKAIVTIKSGQKISLFETQSKEK